MFFSKILWTFTNILEDQIKEAYLEIYEKEEFFSSLFELHLRYMKKKEKLNILPKFLSAFTHNFFFLQMEHQSNFVYLVIFVFIKINSLKDC